MRTVLTTVLEIVAASLIVAGATMLAVWAGLLTAGGLGLVAARQLTRGGAP